MDTRAFLLQRREARMRQGQNAGTFANLITDPETRVAIVPLKEREHEYGYSYAATIDVDDNTSGLVLRNRAKSVADLWNACREPDNFDKKVWVSVDQMIDDLEAVDIDYLLEQFFAYTTDFSPDLANMTEESLDELKKVFGSLQLKELTGKEQAAVSICLSLLLPTRQLAKSLGSTSTESSTERTDDVEPIPLVAQS